MRDFIGLIAGLYLTVALVVFGGAAYSFISGEHAKYSVCAAHADIKAPAGSTTQPSSGQNWVPWALYRALIWPKTYFDDATKTDGLVDWLLVHYNPFPGACL